MLVTLRQHRAGLIGAALGVVVCVAGMVALATVTEHAPRPSTLGNLMTASPLSGYWSWVRLALLALPLLAGIFLGAPLLARDFEEGTHRLAWTQGIRRRRWLTVKLATVLPGVVVAAALLSAVSWLAVGTDMAMERGGPVNQWLYFDVTGLALPAYVLFAVALGIAVGGAVRRTLLAMVLTGIGYVLIRAGIESQLRPRYLPPQMLHGAVAASRLAPDWVVSFDGYGAHALIAVQPAERFWAFQGIEAAIFAALVVILVAVVAGLTLRREV